MYETVVTVLVIYTDEFLPELEACRKKKYAFNVVKGDIKKGDFLKSHNYDTCIQVVTELDEAYTYVNRATGELSDGIKNTNDLPIRMLKIADEDVETITVRRIM